MKKSAVAITRIGRETGNSCSASNIIGGNLSFSCKISGTSPESSTCKNMKRSLSSFKLLLDLIFHLNISHSPIYLHPKLVH